MSRATDSAGAPPGQAGLELSGITAGYGRTTVLREVSISVKTGQVVALLGPNGAGKTTLLRVASGVLGVMGGRVSLQGQDITRRKPFERNRDGLCLVPEGRGVFPNLTVKDNLRLQVPPWRSDRSVDVALDAFPVLKSRLSQTAGSMSGGEQQMLALSRCFLSDPKVVLLDEVSMGLAPRVIDGIFEALDKLAKAGISLLLVEQYVSRALAAADHIYLLNRGTVSFSGSPSEIDEAQLMHRYMGDERTGVSEGAPRTG